MKDFERVKVCPFPMGGGGVFALRDFETGEEIALDCLINNDGLSWSCRCGFPHCRDETVESFFTLSPESKREYCPLLPDWSRRCCTRELIPQTEADTDGDQ